MAKNLTLSLKNGHQNSPGNGIRSPSNAPSIFTHYVLNTVITFLINKPPLSYVADKLYTTQDRGLPFLIAVERPEGANTSNEGDTQEKVCGYTQASPFRGQLLAYGPSVELSLFFLSIQTISPKASEETKHRAREFAGDLEHEVCIQDGFPVKNVLAVMAVDAERKNGGEGLRDWLCSKRVCGERKDEGSGIQIWKMVNFIHALKALVVAKPSKLNR
ncbi:hypothetical protein PAAG_05823 [Paracoccidioides lutzii Pb01]|uniref:Uncharacterized protein n=1 Tax=Paracoccidioides lutzii (strain ATCC MYA-826 / Pb01) TaxID=502779 RepID=C1H4Y2_PARBA|nr:hypothetical protein PAAG_05823 [Paracoccidioides lutzii Pb01]EEH34776.2 hypothetical protein PAAG_05823 [Paracoccidioides lutzii Pb01]